MNLELTRALIDEIFSLEWCGEHLVVPFLISEQEDKKVVTVAVGNFSYLTTIGAYARGRVEQAGYECSFIEIDARSIKGMLDAVTKISTHEKVKNHQKPHGTLDHNRLIERSKTTTFAPFVSNVIANKGSWGELPGSREIARMNEAEVRHLLGREDFIAMKEEQLGALGEWLLERNMQAKISSKKRVNSHKIQIRIKDVCAIVAILLAAYGLICSLHAVIEVWHKPTHLFEKNGAVKVPVN